MNLNDTKTFKKIVILLVIASVLLWTALNYGAAITLILHVISLFSPLIVGACMAFVLNVLLRLFEDKIFKKITEKADKKKKSGRIWCSIVRPLSIVLALVIVFGIVVLVIALIIPELKNSVQLLINEFPGYIDNAQKWINSTLTHYGLEKLDFSIPAVDWKEILDGVTSFLSGSGSDLLNNAAEFTTGVFGVFTNVILGFVFSIYILMQKEELSRQLKGLVYSLLSKDKADTLFGLGRLSNDIFSKFITGQFTEAIIIGSLCFIGMNLLSLTDIFEFPYSLMISVLIGFTALIPVVGAFIGTAVGALLILMDTPIQAVWFVIFIIVLQQLESSLIYPRVVGKSVGLPGIWVLLAVLVGGSIYGILGVIVGVPLCSVIYSILKRFVTMRLDKEDINIDKVEAKDMRKMEE